ncbi:MAG TPA: hypothetical protein VHZ03_08080 [Trebonia sp.]|nr:hypothetical protein [Trebonia sp.]
MARAVGLIVAAEWSGMAACAASVGWEFMVTSQFTAREIASGAAYRGGVPAATSHSHDRRQVNVA